MDKMLAVLNMYYQRKGMRTLSTHRAGWNNIKCPFHSDNNPSARLNADDSGYFYCHVCGTEGDAEGLVMIFEELDYSSAKHFTQNLAGGSHNEVSRTSRSRPSLFGESGIQL